MTIVGFTTIPPNCPVSYSLTADDVTALDVISLDSDGTSVRLKMYYDADLVPVVEEETDYNVTVIGTAGTSETNSAES